MIALVSAIGNAVPAVDRVFDGVAAAPGSEVTDTDKVPFAGGAPDSDAGFSDLSDFSDDVASSTAPDEATGPRVGSGVLNGDSEPNAPTSGPLPAALNPALAAGGPTLGKGCDTVGSAAVVEQAQVAERQAPAQAGAANQLAALMGCRPIS